MNKEMTRILLVEDDKDHAELVSRAFERGARLMVSNGCVAPPRPGRIRASHRWPIAVENPHANNKDDQGVR